MARNRKPSRDPLLKLKNLFRGQVNTSPPKKVISTLRQQAHPQQFPVLVGWLKSNPATRQYLPTVQPKSFNEFRLNTP